MKDHITYSLEKNVWGYKENKEPRSIQMQKESTFRITR